MVFKYLKNLSAGAFMLVCLWSILATSQSQESISSANLYVISDCVNPALEGPVTTVSGQIVAPIGRTYLDFGFPASVVTLDHDISGNVAGKVRTCMITYGDKSVGEGWIYSCFDNNTFNCSIMIKPQ